MVLKTDIERRYQDKTYQAPERLALIGDFRRHATSAEQRVVRCSGFPPPPAGHPRAPGRASAHPTPLGIGRTETVPGPDGV